jgi:hypothetical protein
MLDTPCSEVVRRVLATHSIRQFPLHFLSRASPGAITFQLDSTSSDNCGCWASGRTAAGLYETHGHPVPSICRVNPQVKPQAGYV